TTCSGALAASAVIRPKYTRTPSRDRDLVRAIDFSPGGSRTDRRYCLANRRGILCSGLTKRLYLLRRLHHPDLEKQIRGVGGLDLLKLAAERVLEPDIIETNGTACESPLLQRGCSGVHQTSVWLLFEPAHEGRNRQVVRVLEGLIRGEGVYLEDAAVDPEVVHSNVRHPRPALDQHGGFDLGNDQA